MPIYEFYCRDCHTVFNFFARTINNTRIPGCPRCPRRKLERRMSSFAISKKRAESAARPGAPDVPDDFDEARMESLMEELGREANSLDENDPRQIARLMRRLYEKTGMPMDEKAVEAMRRMEAGEDPDKIEEDLGDIFEGDEGSESPAGEAPEAGPPGKKAGQPIRGWVRRLRPPNVDDTLYDL